MFLPRRPRYLGSMGISDGTTVDSTVERPKLKEGKTVVLKGKGRKERENLKTTYKTKKVQLDRKVTMANQCTYIIRSDGTTNLFFRLFHKKKDYFINN